MEYGWIDGSMGRWIQYVSGSTWRRILEVRKLNGRLADQNTSLRDDTTTCI